MAHVNFEVPDEWVAAADERGLSTREYCYRMIRAGRRQFGAPHAVDEPLANPQTLKLDDTDAKTDIDATLQEWVLTNLSTDDALDTEELLDLLEGDLIAVADDLCDQGKAKYRRSEGGYLKTNSTDE